MNDLDARILPAYTTAVEEITEVIVNRAPTAGPSEPFRCAGCAELSARCAELSARIDLLSAQIESQNIAKQIEKMGICLVDVEVFFGNFMSTESKTTLGSMRGDRNGGANYIRTNDRPTLQRFKLDLVKTHVKECAANNALYKKIVRTYGESEIKELFDFVLSLESNQFVGGGVGANSSEGSGGALSALEQDRAIEWWTD